MAIKGYRILSLEANKIYEDEQKYGAYKMPEDKSEEYFKLFKNVLDDSLDERELKSYKTRGFSFKDNNKNEYTLAIINVKFTYTYKEYNYKNEVVYKKDLKELRECLYATGFHLGGIHYVRYKRSSGSSRQGKCLFIDERLLKHMERWGECGLDSSKGDLASWEAYKSLSLSSLKGTIDIPLEGILFIPDCISKFSEEVISVEENNGELCAIKKETTIKNDIWDGESLLDESLFKGKFKDKHMLLLRNKFFKSCAFKTKLQKWFKDKNITLEDLRAKKFITLATDISQIVMVTTPNSMKFLKFMGNKLTESNVRKWAKKVNSAFGVVKYDKRTKFFDGKMVQSSYQFINTLGFNEQQVEELLRPSKEYLNTIREDYDFMNYHFSVAYKGEKEEDREEISDGLEERSKVIFTLMNINDGFKDTKLYYNFRNDVVESQKDRLKQGHILLPGTNATLFGNGPEMLLALSSEFDINNVKNKSAVLGVGEIYCKKFNNGERLVCARSPHITMGNLYCVTNNKNSTIWEDYFDLGDNIVCVNAISDNIQQRLNGCDYDSDAMLITNDSLIVETAFKQRENFSVPNNDIKPTNKDLSLAELDYNTSENVIGEIVNLSQKLNSILWDKINSDKHEQEEIDKIYCDICKLAVLSGIEIDKAKRSYGTVDTQKELKKLSEKYGKIRPEFFREIDEEEVERQVRKIWDKNKVRQKKMRQEKRDELWSKKEYVFLKTAMEYLYQLANEIDFRKGKEKKANYVAISDMLKVPEKIKSTAYEHREKVLELCEQYKKELEVLYSDLRKADEDEKTLIYEKIQQKKEERKKKVSKWLVTEGDIWLVLKAREEDESENWHLYAPLLENELFKNMLKGSKEKMQKVKPKDDGEYDLYGLKFTKN